MSEESKPTDALVDRFIEKTWGICDPAAPLYFWFGKDAADVVTDSWLATFGRGQSSVAILD